MRIFFFSFSIVIEISAFWQNHKSRVKMLSYCCRKKTFFLTPRLSCGLCSFTILNSRYKPYLKKTLFFYDVRKPQKNFPWSYRIYINVKKDVNNELDVEKIYTCGRILHLVASLSCQYKISENYFVITLAHEVGGEKYWACRSSIMYLHICNAWELNWRTNLIFKVSDYRVEVSAERENGKNHVIEA